MWRSTMTMGIARKSSRDGPREHLWSVVLAGGEGVRMRAFIESWLGYHKPKQYCTFSGDRSLFQQTVDRADRLAPAEHRVMVVARDWADEATFQLRSRAPGLLVPQPRNRGTGPGLLLALARIQAEDPEALVAVYPSDHFVAPEERFLQVVSEALAAGREQTGRIVLLGVPPEGPESDYGWIQPGGRPGRFRSVEAFVEKPCRSESLGLFASGALWNSMVLVGRLETFWRLAERAVPDLVCLFELYRDAVGTLREPAALELIYEVMPTRDFSRDVLANVRDALVVLPLEGVLWSDWGRPERIARTLESIGARPAFTEAHLARSSGSRHPRPSGGSEERGAQSISARADPLLPRAI